MATACTAAAAAPRAGVAVPTRALPVLALSASVLVVAAVAALCWDRGGLEFQAGARGYSTALTALGLAV
ncbi:hypothetical protein, partial [Clavibacter michiganensis]|uniref:hypothetical protein n=1 Tax=Clavibacter michiganensis TaxID=28447 RepID=UPI00292DCBFB